MPLFISIKNVTMSYYTVFILEQDTDLFLK